jgi:hypothetical protein
MVNSIGVVEKIVVINKESIEIPNIATNIFSVALHFVLSIFKLKRICITI